MSEVTDGHRRLGNVGQVVMALLLCVGLLAGTYAIVALGVLGPHLVAELGLSTAQFGSLVTFVYASGVAFSPVAGRVMDRLGGRRAVLVLLCSAGLGWTVLSLAPTYVLLIVGCVISGSALAASNPATNLAISLHIPQHRSGMITGIKQAGQPLAMVVAGTWLPLAASIWNWRIGLATSALAIVPIAVIARVVVPPDEGRAAPDVTLTQLELRVSRWLAIYGFFMAFGLASVIAHTTLYMQNEHGYSIATGGQVLAIIGAAGALARVVLGQVTSRLEHVMPLLFFVAIVATASVLGLWLGAHNMAIMRISALIYGFSASGWYTIAMVVIVRRARTISTGRVSGRALTGFYGGLMPGPAVFGLLVSAVGYDVAWGTLASSFAGAGLVALATVKAERQVISGLDVASKGRP